MAYQLVSAPSSQEAVMSAINSFAVTNGWTLDNYTAASVGVSRGVMSLHRDSCYVSFRWAGTETEATKSIAMYQALGYSSGSAASPWLQSGDSGNGTTSSTNLTTQRRISNIGSGPFISLHLFSFDDDQVSGNTAPTIYCVLEYLPGQYRHFGFGNIDKFGDWTGGEWAGGHVWSTTSSSESDPISTGHSVLLDGRASNASSGVSDFDTATLHVEGLPGQSASGKWGQVWDGDGTGNDTAGNPRADIRGAIRRNLYTYTFGGFVPSSLTGFVPMMPCPIFYRRETVASGERTYLLGYMPNIRMIQLRNYNPGDEVTIGSITWKLFPVTRQVEATGDNEGSDNMGIAYVKEVA